MEPFFIFLIILTFAAVIFDIVVNVLLATKKVPIYNCQLCFGQYIVIASVLSALLKTLYPTEKLILIMLVFIALWIVVTVAMYVTRSSVYNTLLLKEKDKEELGQLLYKSCEELGIDTDCVSFSKNTDSKCEVSVIFKNLDKKTIEQLVSSVSGFVRSKTSVSVVSTVVNFLLDIGAVVSLFYFIQ